MTPPPLQPVLVCDCISSLILPPNCWPLARPFGAGTLEFQQQTLLEDLGDARIMP